MRATPLTHCRLDSGFLFDPRSGVSYRCNPSAAMVIADLRAGHTLHGCSQRLAMAWKLDLDRATEDVRALVGHLIRLGLLPQHAERAS